MLDFEHLRQEVISLPEEAQQTVIDFVQFLIQRYPTDQIQLPQALSFENQPFVGIWSDRTEMQDSTAWVQQVRQQQWQR